MEDEREIMTVKNTEFCTCGRVMSQFDLDCYDTLGADKCTCCPDCGNEDFVTIEQLQGRVKELEDGR